jgi:predicted enzyme related to lactoylglutathione lyase
MTTTTGGTAVLEKVFYTIESDDCRKTGEELKSRGVEFVSDVLEFPWGYVAQFQDPDGNRLQIREGR